jgi:hypothetical protein
MTHSAQTIAFWWLHDPPFQRSAHAAERSFNSPIFGSSKTQKNPALQAGLLDSGTGLFV